MGAIRGDAMGITRSTSAANSITIIEEEGEKPGLIPRQPRVYELGYSINAAEVVLISTPP